MGRPPELGQALAQPPLEPRERGPAHPGSTSAPSAAPAAPAPPPPRVDLSAALGCQYRGTHTHYGKSNRESPCERITAQQSLWVCARNTHRPQSGDVTQWDTVHTLCRNRWQAGRSLERQGAPPGGACPSLLGGGFFPHGAVPSTLRLCRSVSPPQTPCQQVSWGLAGASGCHRRFTWRSDVVETLLSSSPGTRLRQRPRLSALTGECLAPGWWRLWRRL